MPTCDIRIDEKKKKKDIYFLIRLSPFIAPQPHDQVTKRGEAGSAAVMRARPLEFEAVETWKCDYCTSVQYHTHLPYVHTYIHACCIIANTHTAPIHNCVCKHRYHAGSSTGRAS